MFDYMCATFWEKHFLKSTILREEHSDKCDCSYCKQFHGTIGIALPECKKWNAWRIIWWRKNNKLNILRWTLPF